MYENRCKYGLNSAKMEHMFLQAHNVAYIQCTLSGIPSLTSFHLNYNQRVQQAARLEAQATCCALESYDTSDIVTILFYY
jgi:hypothetical protein